MDSHTMIRIIYYSTAAKTPSISDLEKLLDTSWKNNIADDISGVLMYHDMTFFQIIEGPEENVRRLVERIKVDPRHTGFTLTQDTPIETRSFSDWSMGYCPLAEQPDLRQGLFDLKQRRSPPNAEAEQIQILMPFLTAFYATTRLDGRPTARYCD